MGLSRLLYNLSLLLGLIVLAPLWLGYLILVPKTRAGFWEKLGFYPEALIAQLTQPAGERERIWFHAVSVGEFNAIKVEVYQSWTSPSQTNDRGETVQRTLTVWYSPETKRPVKFVSRGSPSANIDTEFELELVNYEVR